MCDNKDGFKLCSCSGALFGDVPQWSLKRRNKEIEPRQWRGLAFGPHHSDDDKVKIQFILSELNSRNCFDFEYSPEVHDFLELRHFLPDYDCANFRYKDGKWILDELDPFHLVRTQLEDFDSGKIEKTDIND